MCPKRATHYSQNSPKLSLTLYWDGSGSGVERVSDLADVEGFWALAARADLELDGLTLVEAAVAIALDVGVVDEHVLIPLDGDESEPLLAIEKLYGASRHEFTFVA